MCLFPLFQNQSPPPSIFCCPLFSENYLNLQFRINKIVNKHTVDYHPSPSELISKIQLHIFLWTPKRFISPESFLNIFLNLYIPLWLRKSFKFIVLRLLGNTFVSKKIESVHFYSYPQAKLSPRFLRKFPIPPEQHFLKIFFPQQKGGERFVELKKLPKLITRIAFCYFVFKTI